MAVSTTVQIRAEDKTKQAFKNVTDRTAKLKSSFGGLTTAVTGAVAAIGIGGLMTSLKDLGDRIGKVSTQIGISSTNLQKLQFAAEQSGLSTDTLNTAMQKFAINIGKANDGAKIQEEAFASLGVATKNLDGTTKSVFDLFKETSEGLGTLTDKTLQARLASELFGRTGVEMTVLFNEGAAGIEKYGNQLASINGIMSEDSINAIQRFNDSWNLMTKTVRGFLMDEKTLNLLSDIIDGWNYGIQQLTEKFVDQEKKVRSINDISEDLKLTRKETLLFQSRIEKSTGKEQTEAIKRLQTNRKQIKALQAELLQAKKIEKNVVKQKETHKEIKKGIEATEKVAKELVKTAEPIMIGGRLDIPAIGGRRGLGGTLEKFVKFYLDLMILTEDYLGGSYGVTNIVETHLDTVKQDFDELVTGMENQLVFKRNDISYAFSQILLDFETQLKKFDVEDIFSLDNTFVYVPADIFDFSQTEIDVPPSIFQFDEKMILQAEDVLDVQGKVTVKVEDKTNIDWDKMNRETTSNVRALVNRMNDVEVMNSYGGYSPIYVGGARDDRYGYGYSPPMVGSPTEMSYYRNDYLHEAGSKIQMSPVGDTQTNYTGNYLKTNSTRSGRAPLSGTAGRESTNIEVNVYDGTGQKLNAYDSAIRVEINERASRNDHFPALAA